MEPSPGNPAPARPRYRVRTLLIATTLAAVVLACLAPWLRTLTESQWIGIVGRVGFLVVGCWGGTQISLWTYRRCARRERAAELGIKARCTKVLPASFMWFTVIGVLFVTLLLDDWIGFGSRSARAGTRVIPIAVALLLWMNSGLQLGRCIVASIGRCRIVYLTPVWLISPWVSSRWYMGIEYHWQDRSSGKLNIRVPESYRLELSIPPENVDEVDRILSHMLDPPKYRPPVVPPPPAT